MAIDRRGVSRITLWLSSIFVLASLSGSGHVRAQAVPAAPTVIDFEAQGGTGLEGAVINGATFSTFNGDDGSFLVEDEFGVFVPHSGTFLALKGDGFSDPPFPPAIQVSFADPVYTVGAWFTGLPATVTAYDSSGVEIGQVTATPGFDEVEFAMLDFAAPAHRIVIASGGGGIGFDDLTFDTQPRPRVAATVPAQNATSVAAAGNLQITFDRRMDPASIGPSTVSMHGNLTGSFSPVFAYDAASMLLTIDPDSDMKPGEDITITLTEGLESIHGEPLFRPHVLAFTVAAAAGAGHLQPGPIIASVAGPYHVTAGDLDGDGDVDLVVLGSSNNFLKVLRSNGDGTFEAPAEYHMVTSGIDEVYLADVDADGDLDLIANGAAANQLAVRKNLGDGTFGAFGDKAVYGGLGFLPSMAVGDLDGDGDIDIVGRNQDSGYLLLNDGTGAFSAAPRFRTPDSHARVADFDRDGDLDVFASASWTEFSDLSSNDGHGVFTHELFGTGFIVSAVGAADLDGDGDLDLALGHAGSSQLTLFVNGGGAGFASGATLDLTAPAIDVDACDLDADTDLDLVASNGSAVSIFINDGTGAFGDRKDAVGASTGRFDCADMDADGDIDVIVPNPSEGTISILLNADTIDPIVNVVRPSAAGEKLFTGTPYLIQWTASDNDVLDRFDVFVSVNGGASYVPIAACTGLPGSARSCAWTPGPTTTKGRIRVVATDASENSAQDASDSNFTILSGVAVLTVKQPSKASTNWGYGTTQTVTWMTNLGAAARVSVLMSTDGGATWPHLLAADVPALSKKAIVEVPALPTATTQARIKVELAADPSISGVSAQNFKIEPPFLTLKRPNGPMHVWTVGTTQKVIWNDNLGEAEHVRIELSLDGGSTYTEVLSASTPSDGTENVVVQAGWVSTAARVKVTWLKNGAVFDVSNNSFPIR